jgi:ankyrin repeat domain-containing protein 50
LLVDFQNKMGVPSKIKGCLSRKSKKRLNGAQPPPEQVAPSDPQPLNPASTLPAAAPPSAQSIVSDTPPTSNNTDPWTRAYEIVQERERELMADYGAAANADLSKKESVESMVNKLWEDREKKQWRVTILGSDINIRNQVESLAKFLLLADPIVQKALSTQPHVALAWSGVSLLLPVDK